MSSSVLQVAMGFGIVLLSQPLYFLLLNFFAFFIIDFNEVCRSETSIMGMERFGWIAMRGELD